jgi:hypothetical protein
MLAPLLFSAVKVDMMRCALVPWKAKELIPVGDEASLGISCRGAETLPAVCLSKIVAT